MNPQRTPPSPPMVTPVQEPPSRSRGVFLLALLGLLLLGGAVGGVLWWKGQGNASVNKDAPKPDQENPTPDHPTCSDNADPKYYEPIEYGPGIEVAFDRTKLDTLADLAIPEIERYPWLPENLVAILGEHRMRGDLLAVGLAGKLLATGLTNSPFVRIGEVDTLHEARVLRCPAGVHYLAWSPTADSLAVVCNDGAIRLYDVSDPERFGPPVMMDKIPHHLRTVCFSGDGKYLLGNDTQNDIGSAWVWDIATQKVVQELKHFGPVQHVAFSPVAGDYRALTAGGQRDGRLRLWDAVKGTETILDFRRPGFEKTDTQTVVGDVAFSADGKQALSCHPDGKVRVWDLARFKKDQSRHTLDAPQTTTARFSPDGKFLVSAGPPGRPLLLWDLADGTSARSLATPLHVDTMRFVVRPSESLKGGEDEVLLAFTGAQNRDPNVHLLEFPSGKERMSPVGHTWSVADVSCSPTGSTVASVGHDGALRVWKADKGEQRFAVLAGQSTTVGYVPDAKRLYVFGPSYGVVGLFDEATGKSATPAFQTRHNGWVASADITADGRYLVTGGQDGTVRMWRLADGYAMRTFAKGEEQGIAHVSLCPDMRRVIRVNASHTSLLHLRCQQVLHQWDPVLWGEFLPSGQALLFSNRDTTEWKVTGWDKPKQVGERAYRFVNTSIRHLDKDGRRVAVVKGGRVVVSDIEPEREVWSWTPPDHFGGVAGVALSPDGGHLLTANGDGTVYVIRLP